MISAPTERRNLWGKNQRSQSSKEEKMIFSVFVGADNIRSKSGAPNCRVNRQKHLILNQI